MGLGRTGRQVPLLQPEPAPSLGGHRTAAGATVNVLDVHVHVVAAVERPGADVAHKDARHGRVHCPAMSRQVGVLCELRSALVALEEALENASRTGQIAQGWPYTDWCN